MDGSFGVSFCIAGLSVSLLLFLLLGLQALEKNERTIQRALFWFGILICAFLWHFSSALLEITWGQPAYLEGWNYIHWPLFTIALVEFVNVLTLSTDCSIDRNPLVRRHTAKLAGWLFLIPYCLLPVRLKQAMWDGSDLSHLLVSDQILVLASFLSFAVFWLIWIATLIRALWWVRAKVFSYREWLKGQLSQLEGYDLSWLIWFVGILFFAIVVTVIDQLLTMLGASSLSDTAFISYLLVVEALFGAVVVHNIPCMGALKRDLSTTITEPLCPSPARSNTDIAVGAYERSGMTTEDCARVIAKLDKIMDELKPWKEPFLRLPDLAKLTGVKSFQISQAINTDRRKNFYDYVNGFRVDAAEKLLVETDRSVLSISEDVGFNSKSTFNVAFKKKTGLTPSSFRSSQKDTEEKIGPNR